MRCPPPHSPKLLLTGERHDKHFCVQACGRPVELTYASLCAVVRLVIAVAQPGCGFVPTDAVTIRRLRKALDDALGPGAGKRLIQTGCATEYRLTIPKAQIAVGPSFFELEQINAITQEEATALRAKFSTAQIPLQSPRNQKEIQRK